MKIHFDEKADALYLRLDDAPVVESQEVWSGIVLDLDDRNQVVGIEILDVRKRFPNSDPKSVPLDIA
ncbi:MAG: DUF2283 domain-containing protein [Deltaproteobacteria bacterium]|nr:MAG: DUF2283 domain-containing protein [Deltaproteobacteria bacterium]